MEACLEALLEMNFCTKPPNFGVEAHMEAPAGDALILPNTRCGSNLNVKHLTMTLLKATKLLVKSGT
jgi:hypothetical protein